MDIYEFSGLLRNQLGDQVEPRSGESYIANFPSEAILFVTFKDDYFNQETRLTFALGTPRQSEIWVEADAGEDAMTVLEGLISELEAGQHEAKTLDQYIDVDRLLEALEMIVRIYQRVKVSNALAKDKMVEMTEDMATLYSKELKP